MSFQDIDLVPVQKGNIDLEVVFCPTKMEFWILILVLFFATNLIDKSEYVQLEELEELPLQTFDELFVDEWWDKDEAEDLKTPPPTNFGQNVHHQINRQNTQIRQIEPNSTDQLGQIEPNSTDQNAPPLTKSDQSGQIEPVSTDQLGQIEPNSTDQLGQIEPISTVQNPPLTESDHSGKIEHNSADQNAPITESDHSRQNEKIAEDERKQKIVDKFHAMKDEFKQKAKFPSKEWTQIEVKIAKHLKVNRKKIYKWKKEFGLSQINPKNERKNLVEKFDQIKAELKRDGFKNSYKQEIDKTVAKELGITDRTISNWKRELGQTTSKHKHSHSEQKELMKRYYEIKKQNPKFRDENIAKTIKIGRATLYKWKKQFKQQQFHPNSIDGHSVKENAAANVQEIDNPNSGSIKRAMICKFGI